MLDDAGSDFDAMFASASADAEQFKSTRPFATDCLWIVDHAQKSPDYFPGIGAFVLLTIQQPFWTVPDTVADVATRDYDSPYLWGWKPRGLHYLRTNKHALWQSAVECYNGTKSLDELILDYLAVPGLGIVKSSFLAQLTVGQGACLDTLNLRMLGLDENAFKLSKELTVKTIRRRIATYNATWKAAGDSAYWWDAWCELVASRSHNVRGYAMRSIGNSAAAVSHAHRCAITGGIK